MPDAIARYLLLADSIQLLLMCFWVRLFKFVRFCPGSGVRMY